MNTCRIYSGSLSCPVNKLRQSFNTETTYRWALHSSNKRWRYIVRQVVLQMLTIFMVLPTVFWLQENDPMEGDHQFIIVFLKIVPTICWSWYEPDAFLTVKFDKSMIAWQKKLCIRYCFARTSHVLKLHVVWTFGIPNNVFKHISAIGSCRGTRYMISNKYLISDRQGWKSRVLHPLRCVATSWFGGQWGLAHSHNFWTSIPLQQSAHMHERIQVK